MLDAYCAVLVATCVAIGARMVCLKLWWKAVAALLLGLGFIVSFVAVDSGSRRLSLAAAVIFTGSALAMFTGLARD
ncbi:hypothetical protein ACIBW9_17220 [Streptomyces sp. NPDC049541]|uniref:hypothetical protein n=1 Tax=Streptomyces sp. NPDC049541 TaxID=3365594 RepID=UPI0037BA66EE